MSTNPFLANVPILTPLKITENLCDPQGAVISDYWLFQAMAYGITTKSTMNRWMIQTER